MTRTFASGTDLAARAAEQTGLHDFGTDDWQVGLDRLLESVEGRRFTPQGVDKIESMMTAALAGRLQVESWTKNDPSSIAADIDGPTIILGLPRTATTALLNALSVDPHWRYVRQWEAEKPIPPPDINTEHEDPRLEAERSWLANDKTYEGKHIHDPGGPVDDGGLLRLSFRNQELGIPALEYTKWWRDCDMAPAYAYHHKMLRLLHHHRPPRRWLIKAPWHNFHLDALINEYPQARFLVPHRDPSRTIPSVCSLVQTAFGVYQSPEVIDLTSIGRFMLEHLQISVGRLMEFRDRHGDERFYDLQQDAFNIDPLTEIERAYEWLGLPLSPSTRVAMETWANEHRAGARGEHAYEAKDFGLSTQEIRVSFESYTERYLER